MKNLLLLLVAINSVSAYADRIVGADDTKISAASIEAVQKIPSTGALVGSVASSYFGSAYGYEAYYVTVGNVDAPCGGDDCLMQKTFTLIKPQYQGVPVAIYSRQVNANTYSIAIISKAMVGSNDSDGAPIIKKMKILLTVTFTGDGVNAIADEKEEIL